MKRRESVGWCLSGLGGVGGSAVAGMAVFQNGIDGNATNIGRICVGVFIIGVAFVTFPGTRDAFKEIVRDMRSRE